MIAIYPVTCRDCGKKIKDFGYWEELCNECKEKRESPPKKKSGEIETNVPIRGVKKGKK